MAGVFTVNVRAGGRRERVRFFTELQDSLQQIRRSNLRELAHTMRYGDGSVTDQFNRTATVGLRGAKGWQQTRPFGKRPATRPTLRKTGKYLSAWQGRGVGQVERIVRKDGRPGVQIGVDRRVFPQAGVFQSTRATRIRVTPKMRWRLGLDPEIGVWLKKSTRFLTVEPRRVEVNRPMLRRFGRKMLNLAVEAQRKAA